VIPLPDGGSYIYKADQINIVVPSNPTSVGYLGCQSMVTVPVPPGATDSEISGLVSAVMRQVAEQQARCDGILIPLGPKSTWVNTRQIAICVDAPEMKLVGPLPAGVTFDISGLSVAAGVFVSKKSQADADLRAFQYVNNALSVVQCGWWNEEQNFVCPDSSVVTVPANTYFSQVSQDDANQQALTFAATQCTTGGIDWSMLAWSEADFGPGCGFTPSLATGAVFNSHQNPPGGSYTFVENVGQLYYTGSAGNCNLHLRFDISLNGVPVTNPPSDAWIIFVTLKDQDGNIIGGFNSDTTPGHSLLEGLGDGIHEFDFPFVVADAPAGMTYYMSCEVIGDWQVVGSQILCTGTFSNV